MPAGRSPEPERSAVGPIERRRRVRRGWWLRAAWLLGGLAVVGAGWWALSSERVWQTLAERAMVAAQGRLIVERPRGSLLGGMTIDRLVWHDRGLTVAVRGLEAQWDGLALLRGCVRLETLAAQHLDVLTEPSDALLQVPSDVRAPVALEVARLRLGEVVLRTAGSDAPLRVQHAQAGVHYDRRQWRLSGLEVSTSEGRVVANAQVRDRAPFALAAEGQVYWAHADEVWTVGWRAQGDAQGIALSADTQQRGATVHAKLQWLPFAEQPLAQLHLDWTDWDAARWLDHAPTTRLKGSLTLTMPPGQPAWRVRWPRAQGAVTILNQAPGSLQAGRVPITSLESQLTWDGARMRGSGVRLWGPAGLLTGSVESWLPPAGRVPQLDAKLLTRRLDLRAILPGAPSWPVQGAARIRSVAGGVVIGAQLSTGPRTLNTAIWWTQQALVVVHARAAMEQSVAELSGRVAMHAPHAWTLTGRLHGWDPTEWLAVPTYWGRGRLFGTWSAQGQWGPRPAVHASLSLMESRWRDGPLSGQVRADWQPGWLQSMDLRMRWGSSELRARGALGRPDAQLDVALGVPRLAQWPWGWSGRLSAQARLKGALHDPALSWQVSGQDWAQSGLGSAQTVDWQGSVQRVSGLRAALAGRSSASAAVGQSALAVTAQLIGVRVGTQFIDRVQAAVHGDMDGQVITLQAEAGAPQWATQWRAAGAWRHEAGGAWLGQIQQLDWSGDWPARLLEPVNVVWGARGVSFMPWRMELDGAQGARLDVTQLSWQDGAWRVVGALNHVPLRWLRYVPRVAVSGLRWDDADALRLSGRIDLTQTPGPVRSLEGWAEVMRESGDAVLDMPTADGKTEPMAAGLQALQVRLDWQQGKVRGAASVQGSAMGALRVDVSAPWVWRQDSKSPDWQVPLQGQATLELPSLAFARALAGDAWRFAGALSAQADVSGTLAGPRLSGHISGERLLAEQRELGMRLTDGVLRARLRDNVIDLETLRFVSGRGSVQVSGALRPDERSEAVMQLDHLPIPLGAGQRLVVSGEARAALRGGQLALRGRLRADEGVIELTGRNAPRVASDVVRLRDAEAMARYRDEARARRQAAQEAVSTAELAPPVWGFRIVSELEIDLGEALRVFGSGLDARLTGRLNLTGQVPEAPRLHGTLRIAQGTYEGFGQKLEIERGVLVFSGPVDNPAIDIVAYRRYLPVEAGVALSGTAQSPRLVLVSRPDVPEPDKLSWLVLGVGADQSRSGGQNAALQAAAATVLASADPKMTGPGLAKSFGLDVVSIRTGQAGGSGETGAGVSAQDSIVTLGKRLSQRVFISYEQSLRGLQNLLRLQYEITERLSIRGRVGTQNGADLFWNYRYD